MPLFRRRKTPDQHGFTLVEILTVVAIIGTISSIGVVSYESVRASSRDVKRVSDLKQIQTAIELYFENNGRYPDDRRPGPEGQILGLPETRFLTDAGFGPDDDGRVYIVVPKNPEPGGTPYVYRSLEEDGDNCSASACGNYAMLFTLERGTGSYLAGPHAVTPTGIVGAEGGSGGAGITSAGGQIIGLEGIQATLARSATVATNAVAGFVQDERVQAVAETAIAPAATVAVVATTALSTSSAASYAVYFLTQPLVLFGLRKRKKWGTAFNALSRLGEDLVIIRLRDAATGRVLKSTVTDAEGRYSFLAQRGTYRIDVAKHGFVFPSELTAGKREDGPFFDLYHGEPIEVGAEGAVLTPNIPLDPIADSSSDAVIARRERARRIRRAIATASPMLGGAALLIRPTVLTAGLFAAQLVMYLLFRRLATAAEPKNWGIVYDQVTNKPVPEAIARVFEAKFNKLLETQVTDRQGRYHFRVGGNVYYITVTKPGYRKTETNPIDLSTVREPTVIASDLPLQQEEKEIKASSA